MNPAKFFVPRAWVQGAWARDVLLSVDAHGHWCAVQPEATLAERNGAMLLGGPVLPGVVNAHSHAFQRAIAGLTERRGTLGMAQSDDFWSWRDRMYRAALRITPAQLEVIASQLYAELLAGGAPGISSAGTSTVLLTVSTTSRSGQSMPVTLEQ